jgi:urease accessory protein
MKIFHPLCASAVTERFKEALLRHNTAANYPIVFAVYAEAMHLSKNEALTGFCYNAAAGIVTNAVKLIPLGQLSGQEILFSLETVIQAVVQNAMDPDTDMLGVCCPAFDIRCMQHEQLYSRLYMS